MYGFDSARTYEKTRNLMLALAGIALLMSVAAAFLITRSLLRHNRMPALGLMVGQQFRLSASMDHHQHAAVAAPQGLSAPRSGPRALLG